MSQSRDELEREVRMVTANGTSCEIVAFEMAAVRALIDALDEARRERDALKVGLDLPDTDPDARRIIGHDESMCPLCGYVVCPALLSKKDT